MILGSHPGTPMLLNFEINIVGFWQLNAFEKTIVNSRTAAGLLSS